MNEDVQNEVIDLDTMSNMSNLSSTQNKKKYIVLGLLITSLLVIGLGAFLFINKNKSTGDKDANKLKDEVTTTGGNGTGAENLFADGEKTQPSPINGVLYTQKQYEVFTNRRPLAVMINNHVLARPQYGVSYADIVYEIVAEGGITRWAAIFHSQGAGQVGPVRSARVFYASIVAGYNPFYAHWGGAYVNPTDPENTTNPEADVYTYMNKIGLPSLDQAYVGSTEFEGDPAYYRDNSRDVPLEHTGYADTNVLWNLPGTGIPAIYPEAEWKTYTPFGQWQFKEDAEPSLRSKSAILSFNFWDVPEFAVKYEYNVGTNTWDRSQGGQATVDAGNSNKRISPKTVIVMFATERSAGDKKGHLFYDVIGSGTAKIYMDGKETLGKWIKTSATEREIFYDTLGNQIKFDRGQIWVEVLPAGNSVSFVSQ
jgi:hypothetical protein